MQAADPVRKSVLVTGGARGIGAAIVADLQRDHDVTVHHNSTEPDIPASCARIQGDLTDPATPALAVGAALARFGRLDAVIHNAGVVAPSPLNSYDQAVLEAMFAVNLFAAHGLLAAALPYLKQGAAMVCISSVNAVLPPRGAVMYGASKAALELWVRGAAKELGPQGIRINAIAPGPIDVPDAGRDDALKQAFTDMTALGRMGLPQDVAAAVRFLIGDEASYITGDVLTVSGGYRL